MIKLVFSPKWFFGIDIVFEIAAIFITLLISLYGYRIYKLSKNKEHKYFSTSFLLIALSFILKTITSFDIYYSVLKTVDLGFRTVTMVFLYYSDTLHLVGLLASRMLMLIAFFSLFLLTDRGHSKNDIYMISYFLLITTIFSSSAYYLFHITLGFAIFFLCLHFRKNYRKDRKVNKLAVFLSFVLLLTSQLAFTLIFLEEEFYVLGEILMLIGYLVLLLNYISVHKG